MSSPDNMEKLAIVGASGKLGFATLSAILDLELFKPGDIVVTTSSDAGAQKLEAARQRGVEVRRADWNERGTATFEKALQGCGKLFLISSSRIKKDFHYDAPGRKCALGWKGRERDHYRALDAAKKVGVKHVYYTSLAFSNPSLSRVMRAHSRTEEYLRKSATVGLVPPLTFGAPSTHTILRQGLYNESWPLYLGHYSVPDDDRSEVLVAGDSKISWTSIPDLGLANALILAAPSEDWAGKTVYLSQSRSHTLKDVAAMVSKARGKDVELKVVSRTEHEEYYVQERGMDKHFIEWWSRTYDALQQNECEIHDQTLEQLLSTQGREPKPMEETVQEMLKTG